MPVLEADNPTRVIRRRDGRIVYPRAEGRYSTPELLELEREVIESALDGRGAGSAVADEHTVRRFISRRPTLGEEQVRMVER